MPTEACGVDIEDDIVDANDIQASQPSDINIEDNEAEASSVDANILALCGAAAQQQSFCWFAQRDFFVSSAKSADFFS